MGRTGHSTRSMGSYLEISIYKNLSPEKLHAGQEVTEPDMEQQAGSKLGKQYDKGMYCHPVYLISTRSSIKVHHAKCRAE